MKLQYKILKMICLLSILLVSCKKKQEKPYIQVPYPVLVSEVMVADVPVVKSSFGTLLSLTTVNLVGQVSGQIVEIPVEEGAFVKRGDLIAKIDPRIYEANLALAQAAFVKDQAALIYAKQALNSYRKLLPQNFVSQLNIEEYERNVKEAEASVEQDLANIAIAKVNLEYTNIIATIDGVIGFFQLDEGNVVTAGTDSANIVTLLQVKPIYALYALPESSLNVFRQNLSQGKLKVTASFLDNSDKILVGEVALINNTVDPSTGTILVKAIFPNEDLFGWPGQFVRIKTELYTLKNAKIIPISAVQTGQKGEFVYVVTAAGTVQMRPITTSERIEGAVVVTAGLEANEIVVIDGQINLYPGAPVQPMQEIPLVEKKS